MDRRDLLKLLGGTAAFAGWTPLRLEALLTPGGTHRAGVAFFTEAQREIVRVFSDLIIPTTDTPGAVEAGGVEYIELIVSEWYDAGERDRFMLGLAELDVRAEAAGRPSFTAADEPRQISILGALGAEGRRVLAADPDAPDPWFQQARGLVLHGYYTSEIGLKEELRFVGIPGYYDGYAPLSRITRAIPGGGAASDGPVSAEAPRAGVLGTDSAGLRASR